jgi:WD40 repeat protein
MKKKLFAIAFVCAALGAVFAQQETPVFFDKELMNGWLSDPVFSPDGKRLVAVLHTPEGRDRIKRMIVLWDAASGREIRRLPGHNGIGIPSLSYSPDGKRLISGAVDGSVIVWNTETGEKVWTITMPKEIYDPTYSPDGNRIAATLPGDNGYTIKIWDAASGVEMRSLSGNGAVIRSVAYSPDGGQIAASVARTIKIWDTRTGRELRTMNGTQNFFDAVYSPDGKRIAGMHGRSGNSVKIFDAENGQELRDISPGGDVYSVGYSANGRAVLVNTGDDNENYVVKAVDAGTGQELRIINVGAYNVAFSRDGKLIVTPDSIYAADGSIICSWATVWDASSGRKLLTIGYGPLNAGARAYAECRLRGFWVIRPRQDGTKA